MMWRLVQTMRRHEGGYTSPGEFIEDLNRLAQRLEAFHSPRVARLGPGRLRIAAQVFGFHGASLDFRTHSRVTRAAADEVLKKAKLPTEPQEARIKAIQRLLFQPPVRARFSPETNHALEEFRALRTIQV